MHVKQIDGKYHYGPDWEHGGTPKKFGYSLMGTGTAIMHKVYLEMYHNPEILPKGMIEYIDQVQNCEDIGMNVMVTKFLEDVSWPQCSALSIVAHGKINNLQEEARKHACFIFCLLAHRYIYILLSPLLCTVMHSKSLQSPARLKSGRSFISYMATK